MAATESVRKQNNLGGAAGIALLAFALAYRFLPGTFHVSPQSQEPVPTSVAPPPPSSLVEQTRDKAPTRDAPVAEPPPAASSRPSDAIAMGPPAPPTKAILALLKKARAAEEQGKLLEPKDGNAIALYRAVLDKDPVNIEAAAGLERIGGAIRDWAAGAIDRGNEDDAQRYVAALADLPHVDIELAQLRAREKTLHQVAPLLARAAMLLQQGAATEPPKDNALAVYREVLALDAGNRVADQGLAQIERGYLDRALGAAAQDDFAGADSVLAEASSIRPGSQALLDTRTRIEGVRRQRAESVLSQARSALDAGDADLAEQLGKRAQAISPDLAGLDDFNQRIRNARLYASLHPGQVLRDNFLDVGGTGPEVVVIPTGSFVMGSPADEADHRDNEEPQRQVRIGVGFALAKDETRVGEFREFVNASGYKTDAERIGSSSVYDEASGRMIDKRGTTWQDDYRGERAADNLPVTHVSWNDAHAYAAWLAQHTGKRYRLASEAEFEYVLRGGHETAYWWGDGVPPKVLANVTGEGDRSPSKRSWTKAFAHYTDGYWGPAPVGTFPANPFGVYDIDGNVSEWVEDCWHDNYVRAPRDSQAWVNPGCGARVIRGGSWGSAPDQVRSAFRMPASPDTRSARVGIRVARDL